MNRVSVDRSISGRSNPITLRDKDSASLFPPIKIPGAGRNPGADLQSRCSPNTSRGRAPELMESLLTGPLAGVLIQSPCGTKIRRLYSRQ
ncbi:hypothetical protein CEXT_364311 [Caerostris extrusa]|uniref:Uncharacterized protein n=1 Tax=Caerostris extrusa TaxID=172846 RepID=A0AAV4U057_CAEEX|nr:hypothetical protein CEXT_364311 [Caerostris extrusa]